MDEKIVIREMKAGDVDAALNLWKMSFNEGFSEAVDTKQSIQNYLKRNPGFSTVACTNDNKLVGALMCGHDGRRGSIYHTAVQKNIEKKELAIRWSNVRFPS
jgi:ribosomal protein S18 acetylase RimI-like enzyme